ncbi:MAG: hypothetical protein ACREBB_02800 [Nitrosotalea sp.]
MRKKVAKDNGFAGTWHIYKMETWDADYFNMEVRAYVKIGSKNTGDFQFGLVHGEIDGRVVECCGERRLEFTWDGNDEYDPVSGSGWAKIMKKDLEGEIRIHRGDSSLFWARKAKVGSAF